VNACYVLSSPRLKRILTRKRLLKVIVPEKYMENSIIWQDIVKTWIEKLIRGVKNGKDGEASAFVRADGKKKTLNFWLRSGIIWLFNNPTVNCTYVLCMLLL